MNRARTVVVSGKRQADHAAELTRKGVANDGDDADGSQRDEREGNAIVARNDVEVLRLVLDDVVHLRDVARRLFDGNHVLEVACDAEGGLGRHVDAGTSGHVVEDDWEGCRFRNRLVVLINAFLRGFVIVRNDGKDGVDAVEILAFELVDDGPRAVAAHSQDNGDSPVYFRHNQMDDLLFLFFRKGGRLGGCPQNDQIICPVLQLVVHQTGKCFVIYAFVFFEGSNQRYSHSF